LITGDEEWIVLNNIKR
ncbi:hypothetical protein EAI_08805, partial [Harpegnathos saltator]